jgi:hypothetical protein
MSEGPAKRVDTGRVATTTTSTTTTVLIEEEKILAMFNSFICWARIGYHVESADNKAKYGSILERFRHLRPPKLKNLAYYGTRSKVNIRRSIGSIDFRSEITEGVMSRLTLEWSQSMFICFLSIHPSTRPPRLPSPTLSVDSINSFAERFDVLYSFQMELPRESEDGNAIFAVKDLWSHPLTRSPGDSSNKLKNITELSEVVNYRFNYYLDFRVWRTITSMRYPSDVKTLLEAYENFVPWITRADSTMCAIGATASPVERMVFSFENFRTEFEEKEEKKEEKERRKFEFPKYLVDMVYDMLFEKVMVNYHQLPNYVIRPNALLVGYSSTTTPIVTTTTTITTTTTTTADINNNSTISSITNVIPPHDLTTEEKRVFVRSAIMDLLALNGKGTIGLSAHIFGYYTGWQLAMTMILNQADGAPGHTKQRLTLEYNEHDLKNPSLFFELNLFSAPINISTPAAVNPTYGTTSVGTHDPQKLYIHMELYKYNVNSRHLLPQANLNVVRIFPHFPTNNANDDTTNLITETTYYHNEHYAHDIFQTSGVEVPTIRRFSDTLEVNSALKDGKAEVKSGIDLEVDVHSYYNEISIHALYHALRPWIVELRKLGLGGPPPLQATASRITFEHTKPTDVASSTATTSTTQTNLNATAKMNTAKPSYFSKLEKLPFK